MDKRTNSLIPLTIRLMDALLVGDDPMLEALRMQYKQATIGDYQLTDVGFFVGFTLPDGTPPVHPVAFDIGDVFIEFEQRVSEGMALLAIRNGVITYLEAVTIEGDWPQDVQIQHLNYSTRTSRASNVYVQASERDMEIARAFWT